VAAYRDNVDAVAFLVDKGADINIKDKCDRTPMHLAARKGNLDTVRYLCDKGADLNIRDSRGVSE